MHDDQRVQYKLAVTVHRCLWHRAPWYFADYCVSVSEVPGRQHLRSARCHQLSVWELCALSVADQQSGIYCLIICRVQLLTQNNMGET